jgi:putative phosphonate metabolism protein
MAAGPRYAIYFIPETETALARFGAAWIGRDLSTGDRVAQPVLDTVTPGRLAEITVSPRHYGFHATLKPPFHLAEDETVEAFEAAVARFAQARSGFVLAPLTLRAIDRFIALVPDERSAALHALADNCIADFDCFRAPADAAEIENRRKAGLNPRQDAYLLRWGYPYVFDEFRFHMTLTERLGDDEREKVLAALAPLVAPVLAETVRVEGIAICQQPDRQAPFTLRRRFFFGA